MALKVLIPEAGGDLGVGARKMAMELRVPVDLLLLEADVSKVQGLGHPFAEIPIISTNKEEATQSLLDLLGDPALTGGKILPTGEFFPEILYGPRISEALKKYRVETFIPPKKGWEISRDKLLLGEFSWAVPTSEEWSLDRPYGKPRDGVGARGCGLIKTREEANSLGEGYIFTEYLPGNDWVVDLLRVGGECYALTREVFRQRSGADTNFVYRSRPDLESTALRVAVDLGAPVVNVQFRESFSGKPCVIDVGTRLSGASCAARLVGVNWVGGLLGDPDWWSPRKDWEGKRVVRFWEENLV